MTFAGLRGAIAFALALQMNDKDVVSCTIVIVLLTTLLLGGLTSPLVHALGLANEAKGGGGGGSGHGAKDDEDDPEPPSRLASVVGTFTDSVRGAALERGVRNHRIGSCSCSRPMLALLLTQRPAHSQALLEDAVADTDMERQRAAAAGVTANGTERVPLKRRRSPLHRWWRRIDRNYLQKWFGGPASASERKPPPPLGTLASHHLSLFDASAAPPTAVRQGAAPPLLSHGSDRIGSADSLSRPGSSAERHAERGGGAPGAAAFADGGSYTEAGGGGGDDDMAALKASHARLGSRLLSPHAHSVCSSWGAPSRAPDGGEADDGGGGGGGGGPRRGASYASVGSFAGGGEGARGGLLYEEDSMYDDDDDDADDLDAIAERAAAEDILYLVRSSSHDAFVQPLRAAAYVRARKAQSFHGGGSMASLSVPPPVAPASQP